ncbi:MAG: ATP-binding cassette domain-containing protein [Oscillospiraceae bacterium]|jgi:excinuclease UvrABC ATPase subunit|nr:ATP-binding cassette domain-containing protein [Oscillospiraceae bacterium]
MVTPFYDLNRWIEAVEKENKVNDLSLVISRLKSFVKKANELDLGHLSINRAIPTLSGGELQRLRLVQVFNTQLSDLLIILDEPLAGLSGDDRESVYDNIISLSEKHTLLIVDHHKSFLSKAKTIIALGEKSGKNGGFLINAQKYFDSQKIKYNYTKNKIYKTFSILLDNDVYSYNGVSISIAENCKNLILGKSGVGKTTVLREYFPQFFEHYTYINQKPLLGNKDSYVATLLDVFNKIADGYAKKFKKDKKFFSNLTGNEGACPLCRGAGFIEYGNDYNLAKIECHECEGTGFNENLKKFCLNGKSIFDIWKMTIDEAIIFYSEIDKKLADILSEASALLLGHLTIGQPTATLSGGENIRIKMLKATTTTSLIYGIDEPFRGLGVTEIYYVIQYLDKLTQKGKTIIVADHEEESFKFFSNIIMLENREGKLLGKPYH